MTRNILKLPLFGVGLSLRLALIAVLLPVAATQWYVPFLSSSLAHFSLAPYHEFIASGGTLLAFPYGYVMWLVFLPLTALCSVIGAPVYWGYGLTLLGADIAMLLVLRQLIPITDRRLVLIYWLSPILLFATYWLGLNDIVPVFFLCLALVYLRRRKAMVAGFICGAAISAKLSMLLAAPLFAIYLYRNKPLRRFLPRFIGGLAIATLLLGLPFALSPDARLMLFSNPEMEKVYKLAVSFAGGATFYILPMAWLLVAYAAWHMRRMSFDLFFVVLGIAFFLVLLLTPAAPGWFLWVLPLLVYYQALRGRSAVLLVGIFTVLYVLGNFLDMTQPLLFGGHVIGDFAVLLKNCLGAKGSGLLNTALLTLGIIIMFRIWRETVQANDYFRISRKPFSIGIAGDSGAGKDTLVTALTGLFGEHSVVTLSGDDYHFWDRHKPMWQVMTHLNPHANDLEQFGRDFLALNGGKPIAAPHYDHASGRKSKPRFIKSNDFILASGLHALYLPSLRENYSLGIYLDIDENLRRYFKIQRDVKQRGHSLEKVLDALDRRAADARQFIRPQRAWADVVLSLQPLRPFDPAAVEGPPPRMKLTIRARPGWNENELVRVLVGMCGLHVDVEMDAGNAHIVMAIEGDITADDIEFAAARLLPEMSQLLDTKPCWKDGVEGLMQLAVLSHVNQAMRGRIR